MPERIQLKRAKGWRMPENTISVARPGRWGNPFYVSRWRDATTCVALFRNAMHGIWNPDTSAHGPPAWSGYDEHQAWRLKMGTHPMDLIHELRGKNLACWCRIGDPCHADVLLELANAPQEAEPRKAFWAKCEKCRHCWPAAYYPIELAAMARVLKGVTCPHGCAGAPVLAKQDDGVLLEPQEGSAT